MGKRTPIKYRLLTILLLGVIVSALSVGALARLLNVSTQHRIERARDEVLEQVERLARDPNALAEAAPGGVVGMRAGIAAGPLDGVVPSTWATRLEAALARSERASPHWQHSEIANATLVIAARRLASGRVAWAAMEVRPLPQIRAWQTTIWLLALATSVLVATTLRAAIVMQRAAGALGASLEALAHDLAAPVPEPTLRELADVADGIRRLSKSLAQARAEEKRLAGELSENERLAALGRVAAGVAHEVRNPLASIKLRLDLAASSARLPDAVSAAIAHATSEIERLDRLVADLLVVAGRSTGPRVVLSLGALSRARVEALSPWAREHGVGFRVEGDARVTAHADSLGRALDNLLRNAVEASPHGAEVAVQIERSGERTRLVVCDRGPGVPAERAAELFEPFFTTKPDGTGLGLPLARSIARAHGGELRYASSGQRTRFEIELPAAHEPPEEKPMSRNSDEATSRALREARP